MKPRILHLIGDQRPGGSNYLVQRLIESELKNQFNFTILTLEQAKLHLRELQPDVIVFHYPCNWKYLLDLVYLKCHCPIYICEHHYCRGFVEFEVPSSFRFYTLLRLAYGLVNGVIAVSHAQGEWMRKNRLVNPDKVQVISPALPIDALLKLPSKLLQTPLVLGSYGRFAPQKGFDLLLQAIALVQPAKVQLRLGGYGQDEDKINDLARHLPHVTLVGPIDNVADFLSTCDVVVIPSRWEAWGLVCLEAKAAGKPVIVSAVDGLKEQVKSCGVLVQANDVRQLAKEIDQLPKHKLVMWGRQGRANVSSAWQDCLRSWENFFIQIT